MILEFSIFANNMRSLCLLFCISAGLVSIHSRSDDDYSEVFERHYEEDESYFQRKQVIADDFLVAWEVDLDEGTITFELEVKTKGYVGFGFGNRRTILTNADLILGGVNDDKTTYFLDCFELRHGLPVTDEIQNWFLLEALESGDTTILRFWRELDTGDAEDLPILDEDTHFIWAVGDTDDTKGYLDVRRGASPVNMLEPPPVPEEVGPSSRDPRYTPPDFVRTKQLSEDITVTWEVLFGSERVIFEIEAKTQGYIGFGISDKGSWEFADVFIGGVTGDRSRYFADYYSNGGLPVVDGSQDWRLLEVFENGRSTFIRVIRNFDTDHLGQDIVIRDKRTNFVWALGYSDDLTSEAVKGSYAVNIFHSFEPQNFVRAEQVADDVFISWEVDFGAERIIFEVLSNTKGYVGFGVSRKGDISELDLIIGGVKDDLCSYFSDRYSYRHREPKMDVEQNWLLLSAREQRNQTYLKFIRDFDTEDTEQDIAITNVELYLTWALGTTDDITRHEREKRGSFAANLLQVPDVPPNFERTVKLSSEFDLSWQVNFLMRRITFNASVSTTGYIGLGINPSGTMYNLDLIIGGVDRDGKSYFNDRFSVRRGLPPIDQHQDWFLESASEGSNGTNLVFYRNFDTKDVENDFAIKDEYTHLVWAVGSSDDIVRSNANRGSYRVNLLRAHEPDPTTTEDYPRENFRRTEEITEGFRVTWDVAFDTEIVTFQVEVKTRGYVGFGVGKDGTMTGADLIIGGVNDGKSSSYFADRYSSGNGLPKEDFKQDWTLIVATETEDTTFLKFQRAFNTGDETEDLPLAYEQTYFLWAIGSSDSLDYHEVRRGSFQVNILHSAGTSTTPVPSETTTDSSSIESTTTCSSLITFTLSLSLPMILPLVGKYLL